MDTITMTPVVAASSGKAVKFPRRFGRGCPDIRRNYAAELKCSCDRDKVLVFCRGCGYFCHGRIRIMCVVHPRVTFLHDIDTCPKCHTSTFLDEQRKD